MKRSASVFIDSSVLIAAAISSKGAARALIILAFRGQVKLCASQLVLEETKRNIARKIPQAVPSFELLHEALPVEIVDPPKALVLHVAESVVPQDAPIVAAAMHSQVQWLATYDRKHLLSQKEQIGARLAVTVLTPDEILKLLEQP